MKTTQSGCWLLAVSAAGPTRPLLRVFVDPTQFPAYFKRQLHHGVHPVEMHALPCSYSTWPLTQVTMETENVITMTFLAKQYRRSLGQQWRVLLFITLGFLACCEHKSSATKETLKGKKCIGSSGHKITPQPGWYRRRGIRVGTLSLMNGCRGSDEKSTCQVLRQRFHSAKLKLVTYIFTC